jgi:hypothetical protein
MMSKTKDSITKDEALDLIRFRATEALDQTKDSDTWAREYWDLRNALNDVLYLLNSIRAD